jgi:hypothetical protein
MSAATAPTTWLSRELGPGHDDVGEFAAELAGAGLHPAEAAFLIPEVARSHPLGDAELLAKVARQDLRDAAQYLAANPDLDAIADDHDLWRYPTALRWAASKWRDRR